MWFENDRLQQQLSSGVWHYQTLLSGHSANCYMVTSHVWLTKAGGKLTTYNYHLIRTLSIMIDDTCHVQA